MYRFFVKPEQINDKIVILDGPDVNHIKNVLRMKEGEEVNISNGVDPRDYRCGILKIEDEQITLEVRFVKEESHELPSKVYLFQGLPKADKMESIIQKNIELGVFEIIPVEMKRCVVKLDSKKAASKVSRWSGIAEAAAKQSKRGVIPKVLMPMSFKDAVNFAQDNCELKFLPYEMAEGMEYTRHLFDEINPGKSIAVFIGPEGGFDDSEIAYATDKGFNIITLGKRILRTETAGMAVMSVLSYLLEE